MVGFRRWTGVVTLAGASALAAAACRPGAKGIDVGATGTGSGTGTATGGGFQPVLPGSLPTDPGLAEAGFSGFLTGADVGPGGGEAALPPADLAELMNGYRDVFFLKNPKKRFDATDCNDAAFDAASFQATRAALVFQVETPDFSACLNTAPPPDPNVTLRYTSATIKYFDKTTCEGVDLSALNGKPPSQITEADQAICDQARTANQLRNAVLSYKFTVTAGQASLAVDVTSTVSVMTADGKACRGVNGDAAGWTYEPCRYVVRTVYSFGAAQGDVAQLQALYRNTYLRADGEGLKGDPPGPYFTAGRMTVVLNNWTGSMTYAGAQQPPTWQLTGGAEPATGTFTGE